MSLRRIGVLLRKEISQGWRNVMFIFAVVMPIVLTVVVSLLFGTVFSGKARLGLADEGTSQLVARARALESLEVKVYTSAAQLRAATAEGAVDLGVVLPAGFDERIIRGEPASLVAYLWGESTLRNRAVLGSTLATLIRDLAGQEAPVEIVTTTLGGEAAVPWETRLLPFILMMAMFLSGGMVPAATLVEEKQKRTLRALTTSPVSLGEVFAAKGLLGVILSVVMVAVTLVLNRAWGGEPLLLLATLVLGAIMAAAVGILLGAFIRDINTLFTVIKGAGILLYAPVIVYLFPEIPQWIGRIFPTYYMIGPLVEITLEGGTFATVAPELAVLVGLNVLLIAVIAAVAARAPQSEGALNPA
ncbi:MAG: ABC transporter permease [Anaerolineae bacterium]|nr:ABC transporter permease [Anaerolineae bacterium]